MTRPLPASAYFDERILADELSAVFSDALVYLGHRSAIGEVGDWRSLEAFDHGRVLVRTPDGPRLLANVCSHRGGQLARGAGHGSQLVCPLHKWAYELDGRFKGALGFDDTTACRGLPSWPVQEWEGLLFTGDRDLARDLAPVRSRMSEARADWVFDRVEVSELAVNWKVMLEVFLDNLHVAPYHPGFGRFVDTAAVASGEGSLAGERFNFHAVGPGRWDRPATEAFRRFQAAIERVCGGRPTTAATWLFVYPNTMLEWYPATFVASTFWPIDATRTRTAVEVYYHPAAAADADFKAAEVATADETAGEDDELGLALQRGRRTAYELGLELAGPTHPKMESALARYWAWLRERVDYGATRPR